MKRKSKRGGLRSPAGGRPPSEDGPGHKVLVTIPQWALPAVRAAADAMGKPLSTACKVWVVRAASRPPKG